MTTQERELLERLNGAAAFLRSARVPIVGPPGETELRHALAVADAASEITRLRSALAAQEEVHTSAPQTETPSPKLGDLYAIEHDGFVGTVIGFYQRSDGYKGVVMQQAGTKIVHVYGLKWLSQIDQRETE